MHKNGIGLIVVMALLGSVGCGKKAPESMADKLMEKSVEKAIEANSKGEAKVDFSGDKMTIQTDEGTFSADASGNASIPANFPKDIPVPESTKVMSAVNTPEGVFLTLEGPADVAAALKAFSDKMKAGGWSEESSGNFSGQLMASFKKDGRDTVVTGSPNGDKSLITLTATLAK